MNIKSVTYQKVYAIGAYITERIGVEASVDEGQDPKFVLAELKKLCDEVNTANNPHLTETNAPEPTTLPTLKVEREQKPTSIEDQIKACTQLEGDDGLASFKQVAQRDQELMKLYMEQLKKITNGI
jgi:hypothetical protein